MSDEEPAKTFTVNLRDPLLALFASSVELIIKRVVVVDNVFICFFHVVTIPHFQRKSKLFFLFLCIFFIKIELDNPTPFLKKLVCVCVANWRGESFINLSTGSPHAFIGTWQTGHELHLVFKKNNQTL
tara:strand:+ start:448 stop:831 length:384 start_codon:yes stop_codon:yes gene_type:complete